MESYWSWSGINPELIWLVWWIFWVYHIMIGSWDLLVGLFDGTVLTSYNWYDYYVFIFWYAYHGMYIIYTAIIMLHDINVSFMISCGVVFLHRISHWCHITSLLVDMYVYIYVNLFTLKYRPLHPHIYSWIKKSLENCQKVSFGRFFFGVVSSISSGLIYIDS